MNSIKPKLKKEYDTVGIFASSSPDAVNFPCRYERAIDNISKTFKNVITTKTTKSKEDFVTASKVERVNQLNNYMKNDEIDLLISLTGGYNTNSILDDLDYEIFKKNCKPIVGYSDTTALQLALYSQIGMVSFYGPSLMSNFGEFPNINEYTLKNLKDILDFRSGTYEYEQSKIQSNEMLFWDKEDNKKSKYTNFNGWKSQGNKEAEGILVGGNLNTLLALAGTKYWPNLNKKILFIEDTFTTPSKFTRDLTTLKHIGVWEQISGLIIGSFFCPNLESNDLEKLNNIIKDLIKEINKPVIYDVNIGHTSPIMTLPIGIQAKIQEKQKTIILLESTII